MPSNSPRSGRSAVVARRDQRIESRDGSARARRRFLPTDGRSVRELEERLLLSTIARTSGAYFYIDSKNLYSGNYLQSEYVSYQVTNTDGKSYSDVYARVSNFTGGNVSLASNASDTYEVGSLANGATGNAFFYLTSTGGATTAGQSHTVTFYDGLPSLNKPIATSNFTLSAVQDLNKSSSNKITSATVSNANPTVGDTINVVLTGTTGTIGTNNSYAMYFTPSAFPNFPAAAMELQSSRLQFTGGLNKTYNNLLLVPQSDAARAEGSANYTATFTFRARAELTSSTTFAPVAYIAAGSNNVAHNDVTQLAVVTSVVAMPTTTTLTIPSSSPTYGQSTTFTVNVAANGSTPTPGTSVQLYVDSALVQSSTIDASGNATFTVARLTATTHNIQAKYIGDSQFAPSQSLVRSLTVNPAPLSVTGVLGVDKVYDGTLAASLNTSGAALVGVIGSDAVTLVKSGASGLFATKSAGSNKVVAVAGFTLSGTDAGNYTITQPTTSATITQAPLTVTGAVANNRVYDGGISAVINTGSATLAGLISGDVVVLSTASAVGQFNNKLVGTAKPVTTSGFSISGTDSANYTLTQPSLAADITPRLLTGSITAADKEYDETASAVITSRSLVGVLGSDQVSYVGGTATFDTIHIGVGKTVTAVGLSLSGADAGNYTVNTTAVTTATITKRALVVTANNSSKTYGDVKVFVGTEFTTAGLLPDDSVTSVTFLCGGAIASASVAGSPYAIIPTNAVGAGLDDYQITYVSGSLTVGLRDLTVTATANDMVYDGSAEAVVVLAANHLATDVVTVNYASAFFTDKNAGVGKNVNVSGITISGSDAGNYRLVNTTATAIATIFPLPLAATVGVSSKEYDRTTSASISSRTLVGVLAGDSVTLTGGTASFDTTEVGNNKPVAIVGLSLTGTDAGNYSISPTAGATADITKRELDITANNGNKTYGDAYLFTGTEFTQVGLLSGDSVTSVTLTSNGSAANAQVNLSPYAIVPTNATGTGLTNYRIIYRDGLLYVAKRGLTATASASSKVYDGTDAASVSLSSNAVAGDIVTIGYSTARFSDKNVGASKTVTVSGIGMSGADSANYTLLNATATSTADISKANLGVGVTASNKIYDGGTSASVSYSDNRVAGDTVIVSSTSAAFADKSAGTGKLVTVSGISISGTDAANYNLVNTSATTTANITPKTLTGSITAANKEYDRTNAAVITGRFVAGVLSGDTVSYVGGTATFASVNPGVGIAVNASGLSLAGSDAGNYTVNTSASTTADIVARVLTITATNAGKTYGTAYGFEGTEFSTSGLLSGDSVTSVTLVSLGSPAKAPVSGSPYAIVPSDAVGVGLSGYSIVYVNGTLTVSAKTLTVSGITANGKVYDGGTSATLNVGGATLNGVVSGDTVTLDTGSGAGNFADKNAGNDKVVNVSGLMLGGGDAGNYVLTQPSTTADISRATLVGSVTVFNKQFDGNTSATINTRTLSGVIGSDVVQLTGGTASFQDPLLGTNKPVDVTGLTLSGASAGNYTVNSDTSTTADITAAHVAVVTANNRTKTYGDTVTFSGTEFTVTGLLEGASITSVTLVSAGAASGAAVSGSPYAIIASDAVGIGLEGYEILYAAGNLTVDPKNLTVSGVTAGNKVYDGGLSATPNTSSANLVGVVPGDSVSLVTTGITATFASKTVADGKTVSVAGLTLSGTAAPNYTLTQPTTTANITPATLTVTGVTAAGKVYDGTTSASIDTGSAVFVGVIGTDVVTLVSSGASASFATSSVGTSKPVTVTGLTLGGTDGGNYVLTQPTPQASITPRTLTITATADSRVYDGTDIAAVSLSNNHLGTDVVVVSHATARFNDKNVGTDKTVTVPGLTLSGADAGNYVLATTVVQTQASIEKLAIQGTVTAASKAYDASNAATITSRLLQGTIAGDDVSYVGGTAVFDSIHVGNNRTVTATGLSLAGTDATNYLVNSTAQTTADITKREVQVTADNQVKTYGDVLVLTGTEFTQTGLLDEDTLTSVTLTTSGAAASAQVYLSPYAIVPSNAQGTGLDDYRIVYNDGKLVVNPRGLSVTATAADKIYDASLDASVSLSANQLNSDVVNLGYTGAAFDSKSAGDGKSVTVSGIFISGADAANYTLLNTEAVTTANVSKREILTEVRVADRPYDETDAATITFRGLDGVLTGDDVSLVGGTARFLDIHIGLDKTVVVTGLTLAGADAENYDIDPTAFTTADITKRDLVVTANNQTKVYGNTFIFDGTEFTSEGLMPDDSITSVTFTSNGIPFDAHVDLSPYAIVPSNVVGIGLDDYHVIYVDGSMKITPRLLSISALVNPKAYDGTTAAVASLSGTFLGTDSVSLAYTAADFLDPRAGIGKAVLISGITLGGEDATNYYLESTTIQSTGDIDRRLLTVRALGVDRTYDAGVGATVVLSDDHVAGDVVQLHYAAASFADKRVGSSKPVSVTGITIDGENAGNYLLENDTTSTTATITPRGLTISALGIDKIYDASSNGTALLSSATFSGDVVRYTYASASYMDKNVGVDKELSVEGIQLAGPDAENYVALNSTASASATIFKRSLTVVPDGVNKTYDNSTIAQVILMDNRIYGDDLSTSYETANFNDPHAGLNKTVEVTGLAVTGSDAGNYDLISTRGSTTADIFKREVGVTAGDQTKLYGNPDPALTYAVSSGSLAPGDSFSGGLARVPGETIGVYPILIGDLSVGDDYSMSFIGANLSIVAGTTGVVTSSSNLVYRGEEVIFTAIFSSPMIGNFPMSGTVAFYEGALYLGSSPLVPQGVSGAGADFVPPTSGRATLPISSLAVGPHVITAVYGGDEHYAGATSETPVEVTVLRAETQTTLTAVTDQSGTTLSAAVTATTPGNPPIYGTVSFYDGDTLLGAAELNDGVATLNVTGLAPGVHMFRAVYAGDAGSSSSSVVTPISTDGPKVTSVKRYGYHWMPTYLVLSFDQALDPTSARNVLNYRITGSNGARINVLAAVYDDATHSVTLRMQHRLGVYLKYNLVVKGRQPGGLTSPTGVALDGSGKDQPGTNYTAKITKANLVITDTLPNGTPIAPAPRTKLGRAASRVAATIARHAR